MPRSWPPAPLRCSHRSQSTSRAVLPLMRYVGELGGGSHCRAPVSAGSCITANDWFALSNHGAPRPPTRKTETSGAYWARILHDTAPTMRDTAVLSFWTLRYGVAYACVGCSGVPTCNLSLFLFLSGRASVRSSHARPDVRSRSRDTAHSTQRRDLSVTSQNIENRMSHLTRDNATRRYSGSQINSAGRTLSAPIK